MVKTEKMTDEELISLIDQHVTDALGYDDAISTQREKAMEYYYGLPFGNEVEGRSQFGSSDVSDTIFSDSVSLDLLGNAVMDWNDDPFKPSFKFTPPTGSHSCGCGSSFQLD